MESEKLNELVIGATKDIVVSLIENNKINKQPKRTGVEGAKECINEVMEAYSEIYRRIYLCCKTQSFESMTDKERSERIGELENILHKK
ncbi:mevalonate kinase [Sporomusaceae bacterium BoRhaA]|uniref:hypothetical protein n=1 Tax=Pelorhabdus rhamnosifermentans TaxID=2772457 RepID=UPI001C05F1C1|nr:hypothetical protein [Pelorhabdus rhamnosifermentans]MBU2701098.1 mevalonate kinase [Pelorhabdus rhamnosifermentans]